MKVCTKHGGATSYNDDAPGCPLCLAGDDLAPGLLPANAPAAPAPDVVIPVSKTDEIILHDADFLIASVHKRLSEELEDLCTKLEYQMEMTFSNLVRSLQTKALTVTATASPAAAISEMPAVAGEKQAPPIRALDHSPEP